MTPPPRRMPAILLTASVLLGMHPAAAGEPAAAAAAAERADTALVLAVDVSGSVDGVRFGLQMEGIAKAFEDARVQQAILSGPHRAIVVALVEWSTKPHLGLPWTLVTSSEDARALAARIRTLPRVDAQFTCMSAALRFVDEKVLPRLPVAADRTVIDVSGDGEDNCNPHEPVDAVRTRIVGGSDSVVINGLPILVGEQAGTLEDWYGEHVVGGPGAFVLAASGYDDFDRAMRQKFIMEISGAVPSPAPLAARSDAAAR